MVKVHKQSSPGQGRRFGTRYGLTVKDWRYMNSCSLILDKLPSAKQLTKRTIRMLCKKMKANTHVKSISISRRETESQQGENKDESLNTSDASDGECSSKRRRRTSPAMDCRNLFKKQSKTSNTDTIAIATVDSTDVTTTTGQSDLMTSERDNVPTESAFIRSDFLGDDISFINGNQMPEHNSTTLIHAFPNETYSVGGNSLFHTTPETTVDSTVITGTHELLTSNADYVSAEISSSFSDFLDEVSSVADGNRFITTEPHSTSQFRTSPSETFAAAEANICDSNYEIAKKTLFQNTPDEQPLRCLVDEDLSAIASNLVTSPFYGLKIPFPNALFEPTDSYGEDRTPLSFSEPCPSIQMYFENMRGLSGLDGRPIDNTDTIQPCSSQSRFAHSVNVSPPFQGHQSSFQTTKNLDYLNGPLGEANVPSTSHNDNKQGQYHQLAGPSNVSKPYQPDVFAAGNAIIKEEAIGTRLKVKVDTTGCVGDCLPRIHSVAKACIDGCQKSNKMFSKTLRESQKSEADSIGDMKSVFPEPLNLPNLTDVASTSVVHSTSNIMTKTNVPAEDDDDDIIILPTPEKHREHPVPSTSDDSRNFAEVTSTSAIPFASIATVRDNGITILPTPERQTECPPMMVTKFSPEQSETLNNFRERFGMTFPESLDSTTKYIILGKVGVMGTIKYIFGVANRCTFLSYTWMEECLRVGKVLLPVPPAHLLHVNSRSDCRNLFRRFCFVLYKPSVELTQNVRALICSCGGEFVVKEDLAQQRNYGNRRLITFTLQNDVPPLEMENFSSQYGAPFICSSFIADSVYTGKAPLLCHYVLSSKEPEQHLSQLGFPKDLYVANHNSSDSSHSRTESHPERSFQMRYPECLGRMAVIYANDRIFFHPINPQRVANTSANATPLQIPEISNTGQNLFLQFHHQMAAAMRPN